MGDSTMEFTWGDYFWVLQAFLRGKFLRQSAYLPHDNFFIVEPQTRTNLNRVKELARWWGFHRAYSHQRKIQPKGLFYVDPDGEEGVPMLRQHDQHWEWGVKPLGE